MGLTAPDAEVEAVARALYVHAAERDGICEADALHEWEHDEHEDYKQLVRSRARAAITALDDARKEPK